jgi:hypothetical protein
MILRLPTGGKPRLRPKTVRKIALYVPFLDCFPFYRFRLTRLNAFSAAFFTQQDRDQLLVGSSQHHRLGQGV